jgi:hypothetical protein
MGIKVMMSTGTRAFVRFAVGVGMLALVSTPGLAELRVSGADGIDGVAVGATYPDDYVFKLPAHSELRVLRSPDNTPFVMHGPFEGTLQNFVRNCSGLLASVRSYCRDTAGEAPPVGGTRSIRRPQQQQ